MYAKFERHILNNRVLVLNKHWFPIGVLSLRNTFCKLFNQRVKAINHNDYNVYQFNDWITIGDEKLSYIRTSSVLVPIPEIVVSSFYDKIPSSYIHSSRKNILKRDKYKCQYSGKKLSPGEATVDHVIPKSKGGKNNWINCVTSSFEINNKKADCFLEQTDFSLMKSPSMPKNKVLFNLPYEFSLPDSWKMFLFKK